MGVARNSLTFYGENISKKYNLYKGTFASHSYEIKSFRLTFDLFG